MALNCYNMQGKVFCEKFVIKSDNENSIELRIISDTYNQSMNYFLSASAHYLIAFEVSMSGWNPPHPLKLQQLKQYQTMQQIQVSNTEDSKYFDQITRCSHSSEALCQPWNYQRVKIKINLLPRPQVQHTTSKTVPQFLRQKARKSVRFCPNGVRSSDMTEFVGEGRKQTPLGCCETNP